MRIPRPASLRRAASLCALLWVLGHPRVAEAQADGRALIEPVAAPDAAAVTRAELEPGLSSYLWSAAAGQAFNLAFQQTALWVLDKPYAHIGFDSMGTNLRSGFVFDEDHFATNQFGHPYQGGLYYASARAQGLGFWRSAPFVLLGSLSWEYLMETEKPSINDLVTTTIGGIVFGEASYRLAEAVLDDGSHGVERFGRELLALVLQPALGFTRLADGRAFQSGPAPHRSPLMLQLQLSSAGGRVKNGFRGTGMRAGLRFEYGELVAPETRPAPFDLFAGEVSVMMLGNRDESLQRLGLELSGMVWGRRFGLCGSNNALFGVWGAFDYLASNVHDLGTSGFGPGIMVELPLSTRWSLLLEGVLLAHFGGMTAEHPLISQRDYDFGVGPGTKLGARLRWRDRGELFLQADRYSFQVLTGVEGKQFAGISTTGLRVELPAGFYAGVLAGVVDQHAWYADYPDVHDSLRSSELFVGWHD